MNAVVTYDATRDRAVVSVAISGTGEGELRPALEAVIRAVAFPDRLLRRPGAGLDDLERAFTRRYVVEAVTATGILDERRFFERCARDESLHELMARYVDFVSGPRPSLLGARLEHDEDHPAGCFAMAPLVSSGTRWVPTLAEYLVATDLGEETVQSALVRLALAAHGLAEENLELLALRVGRSPAQFALGDLHDAVIAHGLDERLADERAATRFLDRVVAHARAAAAQPSVPLGTVAFVLGRGDAAHWKRWADLGRAAHGRELELAEPGPRYAAAPLFVTRWRSSVLASWDDDV
jgi:hypothetical protein